MIERVLLTNHRVYGTIIETVKNSYLAELCSWHPMRARVCLSGCCKDADDHSWPTNRSFVGKPQVERRRSYHVQKPVPTFFPVPRRVDYWRRDPGGLRGDAHSNADEGAANGHQAPGCTYSGACRSQRCAGCTYSGACRSHRCAGCADRHQAPCANGRSCR